MKASDISSRGRSRAAAPASHSAERFGLTGPSVAIDRRINAARSDLADIALAGRLFAPYYARPAPRSCIVPAVPMRAAPDERARAVSELRFGDAFELIDESGGWAWGYSADDHYVGYVPATALGAPALPGHVVRARAALVFAEPDIKAPVVATLPMGARLAGRAEGRFVATDLGFVHQRHLLGADDTTHGDDPARIAEDLVGTPYRWGGRSGAGIDCSGLVQLALAFCDIAAPRDSDQQREALGRELRRDEPPARNDLVFFPGHVGIMADADRLIHANAHWMAVTIEPLADVAARLAPDHAHPILARKRLAS